MAAVARVGVQAGVEHVLVGRALRAPAVGQVAAGAHHIAHAALLALGLQAEAFLAVAADGKGTVDARAALAALGVGVDHPARGVAIQRGIGSAQHLDVLDRLQVDVVRLALAVGHGGGYAVHEDLHAAHAEGRACAMAAYRQLQVLGVVLAVLLSSRPGRGGQRARTDFHLPLAVAHALAIDDGHRGRRILQRRLHQGAAHRDLGQGRAGLRRGALRQGHQAAQSGNAQGPAGACANLIEMHGMLPPLF